MVKHSSSITKTSLSGLVWDLLVTFSFSPKVDEGTSYVQNFFFFLSSFSLLLPFWMCCSYRSGSPAPQNVPRIRSMAQAKLRFLMAFLYWSPPRHLSNKSAGRLPVKKVGIFFWAMPLLLHVAVCRASIMSFWMLHPLIYEKRSSRGF